jgi:amino acid adenylation domain-containing protein
MWFLEQLMPGNAAYNISGSWELTGPLDVAALEWALGQLVVRHEVLRTTFPSEGGRPRQEVGSAPAIRLGLTDLKRLGRSKAHEETKRLAQEHATRPFDLERGPLLQTHLLKLDDQTHALLLTLHHIVADGWSMGILAAELSELYDAKAHGREPALASLSVQYADYAVWQRQSVTDDLRERQLRYWRAQLRDAPTLQLPTDRVRPPMPSHRGGRERFDIPADVSAAVHQLSRRERVSLFMILLAVFQILLSKYTGQRDIVVATPIANRNRKELQGLIGPFLNTLVVRTDLSGNPTFRELLLRVRQVALGAFANQDLPFEEVVEELRPERYVGLNPLTQVIFEFARPQRTSASLHPPGVLTTFDEGVTRFDIELLLHNSPNKGLWGNLIYSTDLFKDTTAKRLIAHYQELLASAAANPDRPLSAIPLMSEAERQLTVMTWNASRAEPPRSMLVHDAVAEQAAREPTREAVVFGDRRMTYAELDHRASQLALRLRKLDVGPEVLVPICIERSPELVVAMLAVLKAGGAYVPLDPAYPPGRLADMVADCGAPLVITERAARARLPTGHGAPLLVFVDGNEVTEGRPRPGPGVASDNIAYVIYTSGSTGRPKGVAVSHAALMNLIAWYQRAYGVGQGDHLAQVCGISFDGAVADIWACLASGSTLHLVPNEETRLVPPRLLEWLGTAGVTVAFLPTPLAEQALVGPFPDRLRLRYMLTGGDKLRRRPPAGLPFVVADNYGPTECAVISTWTVLGPATSDIGGPIDGARVYVLDADDGPAPIGVPGELCIGGAGLARGYVGRPGLTAERFVPDPFSQTPGQRLYRTGDRVRWNSEGAIEYLHRLDSQIKVRGFRVEPGEIEIALATHPAVREAVVIPHEDMVNDVALIAYVVADSDPPSADELRAFLKTRLPDQMIPRAFVNIPAVPLTASGKLDRRALTPPEPTRPELAAPYEVPRTPMEKQVADIWAAVLGVDRVGVHDDFFDLGGHSLLATQVVARVSADLGVDVAVRSVFEAPTIDQFVTTIVRLPQVRPAHGSVIARAPRTRDTQNVRAPRGAD